MSVSVFFIHFHFALKLYILKLSVKCVNFQANVLFADFAPVDIIPANLNLTVYDSGQIRIEDKYFREFVKDIEKGFIKPAIKRTFNLNEIAAAHLYMETNSGGGKIVVLT